MEINPAAPEENHPAADGGLRTRRILRAQRTRRVPKHLNDYIVDLANDTPLPDTSEESTSDNNNSQTLKKLNQILKTLITFLLDTM